MLDAFEGFDGVLDFDVEAVVFVGEVEFAGVSVVGVDDVDVGLAHVGEAVQQRFFDALVVAGDDS